MDGSFPCSCAATLPSLCYMQRDCLVGTDPDVLCWFFFFWVSQRRCCRFRQRTLNSFMAIPTLCALCSTSGPMSNSRDNVQASDFMNDEEGTQELCSQAACWLFGSQGSLLLRPDQASDLALQDCSAPSEDQIQVAASVHAASYRATTYFLLSLFALSSSSIMPGHDARATQSQFAWTHPTSSLLPLPRHCGLHSPESHPFAGLVGAAFL